VFELAATADEASQAALQALVARNDANLASRIGGAGAAPTTSSSVISSGAHKPKEPAMPKGNRETKKPKQDEPKLARDTSLVAT
jgi:hypothetical protein